MRRLGVGRLELAAGLFAALPVIVSAAHSVTVGWIPLGDDAVIATRAYDVPTTHMPLLGQFSASSGILGNGPQSSLGPMLYWLLAIPARLLPPSALIATVALIATASIVGCVVLARRRGGDAFMVATAIAIAVAARSIDPETLSDVWNPAAALFPLLLLMFVSWSVASGEPGLLPVAVVLASFVAQCHLAYVLPALVMLAVAAGGLSLRPVPGIRRALVPAGIAALVCWSAPLLEQLIHRPGNLVQQAGARVEPMLNELDPVVKRASGGDAFVSAYRDLFGALAGFPDIGGMDAEANVARIAGEVSTQALELGIPACAPS